MYQIVAYNVPDALVDTYIADCSATRMAGRGKGPKDPKLDTTSRQPTALHYGAIDTPFFFQRFCRLN